MYSALEGTHVDVTLYPNLDCIKKQRHHFANQVLYSQVLVFPVVMYGYESWTVKKAENQRIDAFQLWCWILENLLDCKEIKAVNPKGNHS